MSRRAIPMCRSEPRRHPRHMIGRRLHAGPSSDKPAQLTSWCAPADRESNALIPAAMRRFVSTVMRGIPDHGPAASAWRFTCGRRLPDCAARGQPTLFAVNKIECASHFSLRCERRRIRLVAEIALGWLTPRRPCRSASSIVQA